MPVLAFAQVHPPCTNCRPNDDKVNEKKSASSIFVYQLIDFKTLFHVAKENPGSKKASKIFALLDSFFSRCKHLSTFDRL